MKNKVLSWENFNESKKCPKCKKSPCSCGKGTKNGVSYEESGLEHPELADLNKDHKISKYEKARGAAIEKAVKAEKTTKK